MLLIRRGTPARTLVCLDYAEWSSRLPCTNCGSGPINQLVYVPETMGVAVLRDDWTFPLCTECMRVRNGKKRNGLPLTKWAWLWYWVRRKLNLHRSIDVLRADHVFRQFVNYAPEPAVVAYWLTLRGINLVVASQSKSTDDK